MNRMIMVFLAGMLTMSVPAAASEYKNYLSRTMEKAFDKNAGAEQVRQALVEFNQSNAAVDREAVLKAIDFIETTEYSKSQSDFDIAKQALMVVKQGADSVKHEDILRLLNVAAVKEVNPAVVMDCLFTVMSAISEARGCKDCESFSSHVGEYIEKIKQIDKSDVCVEISVETVIEKLDAARSGR